MQKPTPNASVVENAKLVLEKFGYNVKTGHLYEMFARVCNQKSWNHASAANIDFLEHLPFTDDEWPIREDVDKNDFLLPISNPKSVWQKLLNALDETNIMIRDEEEVNEALDSVLNPSELWQNHSTDLRSIFVRIWQSEMESFFNRLEKLMPNDPDCAKNFQKHSWAFNFSDQSFLWFAFPSRTMAVVGIQAYYRASVMEQWLKHGKRLKMSKLRSFARFLERMPDEAYAHIREHLPRRLLKMHNTRLELFPVPAGS